MHKNKDEYWDIYYCQPALMANDQYDGWLKKHSSILDGSKKVLDLGCGSGTNISAILEFCESVYAADFSRSALDLVKKEYADMPVSTVCFDMRKAFPFENDFFDVVIADLSLHYFNEQDTKAILAEIRRILKAKGLLLARIHSNKNPTKHNAFAANEPGLYIVDNYQRKYFSSSDVAQLLSEWSIPYLKEHSIYRYSKEKQIIEFVAAKPTNLV